MKEIQIDVQTVAIVEETEYLGIKHQTVVITQGDSQISIAGQALRKLVQAIARRKKGKKIEDTGNGE